MVEDHVAAQLCPSNPPGLPTYPEHGWDSDMTLGGVESGGKGRMHDARLFHTAIPSVQGCVQSTGFHRAGVRARWEFSVRPLEVPLSLSRESIKATQVRRIRLLG
jgi:hypothetical protein